VNLLRRLLSSSTDDRVLHWCPRCRSSVQPSLLRRRACRCGWRTDAPRVAKVRPGQFDIGLRQERPMPVRRSFPEPAPAETEAHPIAARSWRASSPLLAPTLREQDRVALSR
jgi:hypothetical protein